MKTRVATQKDISQITELLNILFSQEVEFVPNKEKQERGLKMIIENPSIGTILVAEQSNKIVASINILYSISTVLGAKVAVIEDMIVDPSMQKDGIGSKLIQFALSFAKEQSCERVTLLTDKNNTLAHKFYSKNGFSQSTMIPFRISLK
jgi:N-acetylglutamate synthase-like GNAT family acetyltransferase